MSSFEGKVAAITGGASGIGRQTALIFAQRGADISISDLQTEAGQETCRMVEALGRKCFFMKVDVTKEAEVSEWIQKTVSTLGGLHIAVNNAGIDGVAAYTDVYPNDVFEKVMDINVNGVWYGMKAQIAHMKANGGGSIVNIASVAGLMALPRNVAYTASKHAVIGMTKVAAVEYARKGIRVNAICPSFTETPMVIDSLVRQDSNLSLDTMGQMNPMKRIAQPEEIAKAIVYLCSEEASYVKRLFIPIKLKKVVNLVYVLPSKINQK
jgi:NAD(P)-dependent dehydrogenase (short-subunit alcohol dehydrogenase family)